MTRTAGKLGKRAPKRAAVLDITRSLTGTVPGHPDAVDYIAAMGGNWQMLGNDEAGDCVAVTWANVVRLISKVLGGTEYYPTLEQVWEIYKTQNPGFDPNGTADTNGPGSEHDCGMDIQTLLEFLHTTGGPDGRKVVVFGSIDPKNVEAVKASIAIFGFVWTGTMVLDINMSQFNNDEPWDYVKGSPVDGGHSIVTGGYGAVQSDVGVPALGGDEKFVTWAQETSFTDTFWEKEVDEVYVVVFEEHLGTRAFLEGIDRDQLCADYQALTGKPLVLPAAA
jgi:hypothetical protein